MNLHMFVVVQAALARTLCRRGDRGQATAEYALVILGAAAVALLVIGWATSTGKISELLDAVIDSVTSRVA